MSRLPPLSENGRSMLAFQHSERREVARPIAVAFDLGDAEDGVPTGSFG